MEIRVKANYIKIFFVTTTLSEVTNSLEVTTWKISFTSSRAIFSCLDAGYSYNLASVSTLLNVSNILICSRGFQVFRSHVKLMLGVPKVLELKFLILGVFLLEVLVLRVLVLGIFGLEILVSAMLILRILVLLEIRVPRVFVLEMLMTEILIFELILSAVLIMSELCMLKMLVLKMLI